VRYPASEKLEIIRLVEQSHLPARRALQQIGIPRSTFYRWCDLYRTGGPEGRRRWTIAARGPIGCGTAANIILTAVGYNFRRILAWLKALLRKILIEILRAFVIRSTLNPAC
jgi:hypothetical protein